MEQSCPRHADRATGVQPGPAHLCTAHVGGRMGTARGRMGSRCRCSEPASDLTLEFMSERVFPLPSADAGLDTDEGLRQADRAYRRRMLGLARRIVVDPHLAEEVVQEAFLRAWRASSTFDPEAGPMLPWLLTITRNAAIDAVKARTRRPPLAARPADDAVESDGLRFENRVL